MGNHTLLGPLFVPDTKFSKVWRDFFQTIRHIPTQGRIRYPNQQTLRECHLHFEILLNVGCSYDITIGYIKYKASVRCSILSIL